MLTDADKLDILAYEHQRAESLRTIQSSLRSSKYVDAGALIAAVLAEIA